MTARPLALEDLARLLESSTAQLELGLGEVEGKLERLEHLVELLVACDKQRLSQPGVHCPHCTGHAPGRKD